MKKLALLLIFVPIIVLGQTKEDVVCKISAVADGTYSTLSEKYLWNEWKEAEGLITIKSNSIHLHTTRGNDLDFYIIEMGEYEEMADGRHLAIHQAISDGERLTIKTLMGFTEDYELYIQFYFYSKISNTAIVFQGNVISE